MSTPNPLAPKGSLLEQQGRGKSTLQIITFIGALHVFFLCGLLWIGCKKDDRNANAGGAADPLAANPGQGAADTNNVAPITPASPTNVVVPPITLPTNVALVTPPPSTNPVAPLVPIPGTGTGTGTGQAEQPSGTTAAGGEYKVQKGDTGVTIARKNNVTLAALKAANPTVKWTALRVDQRIVIPAAAAPSGNNAGTGTGTASGTGAPSGTGTGTAAETAEGASYEVKPGDTGSKIAHKFGVSWKAIRAANHLESDNLKPKQKLVIPAKASGGAAPSSPAPAPVNPAAAPVPAPAGPVAVPVPSARPQ